MCSWRAGKRYLRSHLGKVVCLTLLALATLAVSAKSARYIDGPFGLAGDLPRGPLIYIQCQDLPTLVKRWDTSSLKQNYFNSTNYQKFLDSHVALKLTERWEEFNGALGFALDLATLSNTTENRVAMAIYDIGRLDLVFITMLNDTQAAATEFFHNVSNFEEKESPDGDTYYYQEVKVDRGRQQQQIVFALLQGRFVLATSERLMLRTLANIKSKTKKDRLADEPNFRILSKEVKPHSLTVWVNQEKLNGDWYFRHYWIMKNVDQLKHIRAGIFDFEMGDSKWMERRTFLAAGTQKQSSISQPDAVRIAALLPSELPYFRLHTLDSDDMVANLLSKVVFDQAPEQKHRHHNGQRYYDDDYLYLGGSSDNEYGSRYTYLSYDYDLIINDPVDAKLTNRDHPNYSELQNQTRKRFQSSLQQALQSANPIFAASAESPHAINGPLFAEFRRLAILTLQSPQTFDEPSFQHAMAKLVESQLMVAGTQGDLKWRSRQQKGYSYQELDLPMLGWQLYYTIIGPELVITNSREMLQAVLSGKRQIRMDKAFSRSLDDLTVIRLDHRQEAFDQIVGKLDAERVKAYWRERNAKGTVGPSAEFFTGNIASLLDVASNVQQIEISRSSRPGRLYEEIEIKLKH
ncbi:MAG: hypothetical protein AB1489_35635 [Acidobacteriota bacterium]